MNLTVTGHHLDLTDALRGYLSEKLDRLERHSENVTSVNVILSIEKQRKKAEATIHVPGTTLFADCVNENMYAAIDSLADKLDRQILRHKEKLKDHHKREKERLNLEPDE